MSPLLGTRLLMRIESSVMAAGLGIQKIHANKVVAEKKVVPTGYNNKNYVTQFIISSINDRILPYFFSLVNRS